MAQLPSRTSVMVRSSNALQVLDGLSGPQSCRGGLTARRSASSDSQQSALGTAQTSDEKAVKKERPHGFSLG